MRVVFMGTPDFAVRALRAIVESPHEVIAVYTQPPRPAGRGKAPRKSAIQATSEAAGIPVFAPKSLKDPAAQAEFSALGADICVVAAYGLILPKAVLEAPKFGCINIHGSLLPRWRGAAPIQRAILSGDETSGVTIMQMDEGLDTGPILVAEEIALGAAPTCAELHDRLAVLGARLVVYALNGIGSGVLHAAPQPEEGATYAKKLTRDEGRLDWREAAVVLERRVRAFDPWPGAWFTHQGTRIKVLEARPVAEVVGAEPGEVLDARLTVACGDSSLRILRLQREGKAPQDAGAFLRGFPLAEGTRLELPEGGAGDEGEEGGAR
jgi:methionyl-tRNA formyltransferase